jgi:hypothetical protein
MNERIDDLMYQAGLTAQGCWDEMDDYDQQAIAKFAQLVVEECINVAKEINVTQDNAWYLARILKHQFGIEE